MSTEEHLQPAQSPATSGEAHAPTVPSSATPHMAPMLQPLPSQMNNNNFTSPTKSMRHGNNLQLQDFINDIN